MSSTSDDKITLRDEPTYQCVVCGYWIKPHEAFVVTTQGQRKCLKCVAEWEQLVRTIRDSQHTDIYPLNRRNDNG